VKIIENNEITLQTQTQKTGNDIENTKNKTMKEH